MVLRGQLLGCDRGAAFESVVLDGSTKRTELRGIGRA